MKKSFRFSPAQPGKPYAPGGVLLHSPIYGTKNRRSSTEAHSGLSAFSGHRPFVYPLRRSRRPGDCGFPAAGRPRRAACAARGQTGAGPHQTGSAHLLASDREADAHRRQPTAPLRRRNCLCGPVVLTRCLGGDLPLPAISLERSNLTTSGFLFYPCIESASSLISSQSLQAPRFCVDFAQNGG